MRAHARARPPCLSRACAAQNRIWGNFRSAPDCTREIGSQTPERIRENGLRLRRARQWYICYEEYHPYGSTAYRAASSATDVSDRRYRYTGKEKDEETGLYYHGARYYAPWLGRWTAADPSGVVDGVNLFAYCRGQSDWAERSGWAVAVGLKAVEDSGNFLGTGKSAQARSAQIVPYGSYLDSQGDCCGAVLTSRHGGGARIHGGNRWRRFRARGARRRNCRGR